ncbi:hypothetical protein VITU102760_24950 [Vibrio tubiashii]|uniref:Uncharacterized protein n=2 Tax=Vibrio tubiashii TaxID=29498 RepID=F9T6Q1_9VIBR|nr:hypothetical protein IX91_26070 [Vibrio tubiashii ATCC 19109]EGU54456.1 hypothetical protein VITU9109_02742 [Vibrio tubiashii ATCC 19109]EIF05898.1 hypothetical protein VT1337_01075 [Vibrio tubiashii NCIMB 1337 = ATCC 19106]
MVKNGQKVQVCIDGEPTKSAVVLERIERDYGVVYEVQLEGSNETMIVNESQLQSNLKAVFVESDVSQLKDAPIGESIAANASFKVMLKQDSES